MKDIRYSKKLHIQIRRILVAGVSYTIRPSFAMPYMTGLIQDVEKALFLREFNVPYWASMFSIILIAFLFNLSIHPLPVIVDLAISFTTHWIYRPL